MAIILSYDKWTAFILRFSNQWPLIALYNIASHSTIYEHIHTPMAVSATEVQPARQE